MDASKSEKKEATRRRIVEAAGRSFRKNGFDGIGVDGLAAAAGVTSGAFYVHFQSKAAVFHEVIKEGLSELRDGILYFQAEHGENWWREFVTFYLTFKRTCDLCDSCTLQSLSSEVARADPVLRASFETGLRNVADAVLSGPRSPKAPRDLNGVISALISLVGAVTLSRSVESETLAAQIAECAGKALLGDSWVS